jgi:hypothetical protein
MADEKRKTETVKARDLRTGDRISLASGRATFKVSRTHAWQDQNGRERVTIHVEGLELYAEAESLYERDPSPEAFSVWFPDAEAEGAYYADDKLCAAPIYAIGERKPRDRVDVSEAIKFASEMTGKELRAELETAPAFRHWYVRVSPDAPFFRRVILQRREGGE